MIYRHPSLQFSLGLPAEAEVLSELPPLFALPAPRGTDQAPTVVVTCESLGDEVDAGAWVDEILRQQGQLVSASLLVDRRTVEPDGLEAERTLVSIVRQGTALTLEQWWHRRPGYGWTVTGSCITADYDAAADALQLVAESFSSP